MPVLATEWKVSPDGKEYTFKLRPNVKHASGNPFTAEDVKFSLTRLKNLKGNPGWMMDPLKEVVVVDPMTVKTVLNESFADWLPVLSGPELGHHGLEARQGARGQRLGDRRQGRQGRGVAEPELGRQRPLHPQGLAEEQRHHHGAEPELLEGPGQDREDRGPRRAVARHPEAPGRER